MADTFTGEGMRRLAIRYVGRCQGVGFRWSSKRIADELGLTGWVRNEWDGSVSMELQGPAIEISRFYGKLNAFYQQIHVDFRIDQSDEIPVVEGEPGFAVRH